MRNISSQLCKFIVVSLLLVFSTNFAWALDSLTNAALTGDREKLEALIANGAEVKGDKGGLALYWAAAMGKYEIVQALIAHGTDVNVREPRNGDTPLHAAVVYATNKPLTSGGNRSSLNVPSPSADDTVALNKYRIAELLISHGADVNAKSKGGYTPLYSATTKESAELLIKHGANVSDQTNGGDCPLSSTAALGNQDVVAVLLARGADVNHKNQAGNTPLHVAVSNNHKRIVEMLIKHGAKLGAKDRDGQTPLDIGVQNKNTELVTLLLAHGAQLNDKSKNGVTELHRAVSQGNKLMSERLLTQGAQIASKDLYGRTPLELAIKNGNKELVELLIARGADVNAKGQSGAPLMFGTRNMDLLELLLKHGADANAKDAEGNSLLWHVCYDSTLTELLLKHGADINIKNSHGRTALHLASRFARDNVAKWLITHGANINARDDHYGQTPLFHAIRSYERYPSFAPVRASRVVGGSSKSSSSTSTELGNQSPPATSADDLSGVFPVGPDTSNSEATVRLLLAQGANLNATDRQGQNPLHIAPTKNVAELLLTHGIAVNAKRTDGATALHLSAAYGRKDVVEVLVAHGADVNARTKDDISPLHYAKGSEIVTLLLTNGAKVDATDSRGNTPIYMADEPGVVELLLAHGAKLNAKNNTGQTPLLRVIRTYISNLPAHGLLSGPLGDPIVVAHGGSIEVIKVLLDHGADVNLDDRDGYMPLFYVRDAIKDRSNAEIVDQLKALEDSLLAHGAKLEKRKKESAPQSQHDFLPELAGIPQIDLGTRVLMQAAIQYEARRNTGEENHLYYREPGAINAIFVNRTFDDHLQLLNYFQSLSADVQKNGLWVKRVARHSWTQPDAERIDKLTRYARLVNAPLLLCEPMPPQNGSWLVTWKCDQVSPMSNVQTISCSTAQSKGQPTRYECRKQGN